jgi:hypothetical protein
MKTCTKCGESKPLSKYGKHRRRKDGLNSYCRACCNTYIRRTRDKRREQWSSYTDEEIREYTSEAYCPVCRRSLLSARFAVVRGQSNGLDYACRTCRIIAKRNGIARRAGLPATLTWEQIGDPPERCPVPRCGVVLARVNGSRNNSPSLDRIDPALGYTKQNAIWLCNRCNTKKWDWTPSEMYRFADWLHELYRERGLACPTPGRRVASRCEAARP